MVQAQLTQYFSMHTAHTERAKTQNFKPLTFTQFVSLAQHIQSIGMNL
jgi:hypothetical protein